jgi:hypothetical protein
MLDQVTGAHQPLRAARKITSSRQGPLLIPTARRSISIPMWSSTPPAASPRAWTKPM